MLPRLHSFLLKGGIKGKQSDKNLYIFSQQVRLGNNIKKFETRIISYDSSKMNRKINIKVPANQGNIQVLFQKAKQPVEKIVPKPAEGPTKEDSMKNKLCKTTEDIDAKAFYNSLNVAECFAHTIALEKLGTSYDVTRTHGFVKWKKSLT